VGAGRAKASAPIASTSKVAPKKPTAKPSNPYANYSTAESLGYTDPDAERIAEELEARRSQGVAGAWQVITSPQPPAGSEPGESEPPDAQESAEARVKREAEAPPDEEDARAFKLRKKTVNTGLGEIYDPGLIPIKIKKKEEPMEPKPENLLDSSSGALTNSQAPTTSAPKWTSLQWKRPGDLSQPAQGAPEPTTTSINVKIEVSTSAGAENASSSSTKWAKPQWSEPLPDLEQNARNEIFETVGQLQNGSPIDSKANVKSELDVKTEGQPPQLSEAPPASSLFKKRKAPTGAGRGRRQI
jgi:WW domain-binding protein 4